MNIGNILNRKLGIVTVANLQKVVTNLLETIGFINNALPDSRPYKVYTALLTQTGTSAPIATILENTLNGTPVWARSDFGKYSMTLSDAFTVNKTYCSLGSLYDGDDANQFFEKIRRIDEDSISVITSTSSLSLSDDVLNETFVEIRVYN